VGLPELLHAEDALSMAFSLESRLPFLDHRLVEFCFSLSYDEKISEGWTKVLLRRATHNILPESVRLRRAKLGLPGNYAQWLASGAVLDGIRDLLLDPACLTRGWHNPKVLRERFGGSRERARKWVLRNPSTTWRTITSELWYRQFLDGDVRSRPATGLRTRPGPSAASPLAPVTSE
jgi:asparagine synthase (glutamine-hydrolysing)